MAEKAARRLDLPDLTVPVGDTSTLRQVLSKLARKQLRDLLHLPTTLASPETRQLHLQTASLLQQLARQDLRRAIRIVRLPTHGCLLESLRQRAIPAGDRESFERWLRELCLLVLLEMAVQGDLPEGGVEVACQPGGPPKLRSLTANVLVECAPPVDTLHFSPGVLLIRHGNGERVIDLRADGPADADFESRVRISRPYHRIVDEIFLAEDDNNPCSIFRDHPEQDGRELGLGDRPVQDWLDPLAEAIELIDKFLPLFGEELRLVGRLIFPIGFLPERHLSASYQEMIGTIYMSLHPRVITMAEAIVHEFQHNKLLAAMHLDPLITNAHSDRFRSPVRPDLRPLHGIVLAVHAFQPIAVMYRNMATANHPLSKEPYWRERYQQVLNVNADGTRTTLAHAKATDAGSQLLAEMTRLDEEAAAFIEPPAA